MTDYITLSFPKEDYDGMATGNSEGEVIDNDKTDTFAKVEEKGKTFRRRRLSLTKLSELGNDIADGVDDDDDSDNVGEIPKNTFIQAESSESLENENESNDKAHTFRKRRLSLTSSSNEAATLFASEVEEYEAQGNAKRPRKASDASARSSSSTANAVNTKERNLKSKTLHAAEISSPSKSQSSILPKFYQKAAPPQQHSFGVEFGEKTPKWKERHTRSHAEDDLVLPFPRDVVGTFSCHGVEPIYDDNDPYFALEDGDAGNNSNEKRLTMAAKINQDRGGVAFPYGNSSRTALFAVYDGMELFFMTRCTIDVMS